LQQRETVQPGVNRHDHAQAGVNAFQFFADQRQRDVIEALAAIPYRNVDP
jgi:hypothetical protein